MLPGTASWLFRRFGGSGNPALPGPNEGNCGPTRFCYFRGLVQLLGDLAGGGVNGMVKFRVDRAPLERRSGVNASNLTTAA
jgi:hypothetical protein